MSCPPVALTLDVGHRAGATAAALAVERYTNIHLGLWSICRGSQTVVEASSVSDLWAKTNLLTAISLERLPRLIVTITNKSQFLELTASRNHRKLVAMVWLLASDSNSGRPKECYPNDETINQEQSPLEIGV